MKRISGGQLSREAKPRFYQVTPKVLGRRRATQALPVRPKQSTQNSRVSPPPARGPTGRVGRHRPEPEDDDSDRSPGRAYLGAGESSACSCMQEPRPMHHQHGVQLAARGPNRSQARRPRISPLFLAHSGDVLDQRRALARAQGALSRAERRFPTSPTGDDGPVPRPPDCFRTPPPSSELARPASPAPSPSKTTRPPVTS
jgi:hypothetical protein